MVAAKQAHTSIFCVEAQAQGPGTLLSGTAAAAGKRGIYKCLPAPCPATDL